MTLTTIKAADITVSVSCCSDFSRHFAPYAADAGSPCDISVVVSGDEIRERQKSVPELDARSIEFYLIYEKICDELSRFDAFVLHAATLEYAGRAYAFSALSGTGKSTHAELWMSLLGKGCRYVNGDKPIIRAIDGGAPMAFGTPWTGKEGRGSNISAPLAGICFLVRDSKPSIRRVDKKEGLFRVLSASHQPKDHSLDDRFYGSVGNVVENVPMYELRCDISADSAKMSFETMTGEILK